MSKTDDWSWADYNEFSLFARNSGLPMDISICLEPLAIRLHRSVNGVDCSARTISVNDLNTLAEWLSVNAPALAEHWNAAIDGAELGRRLIRRV